MNLMEDIGAYLAGKGAGETGIDLFFSRLPDDPDEAVALYEYAGLPVSQLDSRFAGLSLQVCTRSGDYAAGLARAQRISGLLKDIGNPDGAAPFLTIGNTLYHKVTALQSPFKLKEDERGRICFTQNFRVWARDNV